MNNPDKGEYGNTMPKITTARLLAMRSLLGVLLKKGDRLVRIAKTTSVWVVMDSMNHAVWKNAPSHGR